MVSAVRFRGGMPMKNADWLDVVASPALGQQPARSDLRNESYESASAARLHTQENKE